MLTEEKLKSYLLDKYHPLAIILHGSRASGKNRPHSDWDVNVVVNQDTPTEQTILDGDAIDVEAIRMDVSDDALMDRVGNNFHSAKILFDIDGVGENLVRRAQALAEKGRVLSPEEYQSRKSFLFRLINRLVDAGESNPIVFDYQLSKFLQRAVNYSFEVDGRWSKSIYDAVSDIESKNPELFKELSLITSNISDTEKTECAERIYKIIFKEEF